MEARKQVFTCRYSTCMRHHSAFGFVTEQERDEHVSNCEYKDMPSLLSEIPKTEKDYLVKLGELCNTPIHPDLLDIDIPIDDKKAIGYLMDYYNTNIKPVTNFEGEASSIVEVDDNSNKGSNNSPKNIDAVKCSENENSKK